MYKQFLFCDHGFFFLLLFFFFFFFFFFWFIYLFSLSARNLIGFGHWIRSSVSDEKNGLKKMQTVWFGFLKKGSTSKKVMQNPFWLEHRVVFSFLSFFLLSFFLSGPPYECCFVVVVRLCLFVCCLFVFLFVCLFCCCGCWWWCFLFLFLFVFSVTVSESVNLKVVMEIILNILQVVDTVSVWITIYTLNLCMQCVSYIMLFGDHPC